MSRLARNCPILTGGKIWNWQKLADECRKCGRPIWCFVVVCNLNILSHLLQVFLTDLQSQHIFSAFACIIKFNRSPKVWSLTIGSSLPIFQRWCVLNLPFWEESVSHWDVKLASKSCWKPQQAYSILGYDTTGQTHKERKRVDPPDNYNDVFCKVWKFLPCDGFSAVKQSWQCMMGKDECPLWPALLVGVRYA